MHEMVQSMVKRIAQKFRPMKITAFGSWARGQLPHS